MLDRFENSFQPLICRWIELAQILDDPVDIGGNGRTPGADKGHTKGPGAPQCLFHVRHQIKGPVVGSEQLPEGVIPGLKDVYPRFIVVHSGRWL
jgi:hypothetical protein